MGKLEAIWIKRAKMGPMDSAREALLVAGKGIAGNANQGGKRQVTIISKEKWESVMARMGLDLDPSARRANLMISGGLDLAESRHKVLKIGDCRVRIYGETKPCELMDMAATGLQAALRPDWGGGAFAEILDDGRIAVGDKVEWAE